MILRNRRSVDLPTDEETTLRIPAVFSDEATLVFSSGKQVDTLRAVDTSRSATLVGQTSVIAELRAASRPEGACLTREPITEAFVLSRLVRPAFAPIPAVDTTVRTRAVSERRSTWILWRFEIMGGALLGVAVALWILARQLLR